MSSLPTVRLHTCDFRRVRTRSSKHVCFHLETGGVVSCLCCCSSSSMMPASRDDILILILTSLHPDVTVAAAGES